jgi:hypothetical protein
VHAAITGRIATWIFIFSTSARKRKPGDEWYDRQIDTDFADLKPKLQGPLSKVMPPWGAAYPLVLTGAHEVTRKGNVSLLDAAEATKQAGIE